MSKFNRAKYLEALEESHGNIRRFNRKWKKFSGWSEVEEAHNEGAADDYFGKPYRNRYPKGKRHDAYDNAYGLEEKEHDTGTT